jgi:hypothetical protein
MATKKKAPANSGKKKASGATGGPPLWRVRVRMYRKWLGDCFLLTFRNGAKLSHILIDCGALSGTPAGKDKLQEAAQLIHDETKGRLDALVITHEHWDHVSGFRDALDIFKTFQVGEVWAAWTEDPNQDVAKEKKKKLTALQLAVGVWAQSDDRVDRLRGAAVAALARFMPPDALTGPLAAFSENTDTAMSDALALGPQKLLSPGMVVKRDWLPGVKIFVLGPPKNVDSLHDMKGTPETDMYGGKDALAASADGISAAFAAAAASQLAVPGLPDHFAPFESHLAWDETAWTGSKDWPALALSYAGDKGRRIDGDWLNTAAELALQLDNYTNNTSLVLAFELDGSRDVLLFVGDAQIGNWITWADLKFPHETEPVNAGNLLERTVFYKVGHHGSHNATRKAGGLEAMTSERLVAAIPVDEQFAHLPKGSKADGWDMPAGPLLKALTAKTKGRVLRADSDFPLGADKPAALTAADWKQFRDHVVVDPHYVEYYLV